MACDYRKLVRLCLGRRFRPSREEVRKCLFAPVVRPNPAA
jgi:hypothetical protein